jgi:hypothetical protein
MTIELTENTIGVWAVSLDSDSDYLAALWRDGENYVMVYRFRYYVDDKTFDSKDKKNWYRCEVQADRTTEDKVIEVMRLSARMLWKQSGGKRYEIMMDARGIEGMMEDMARWPMISMQTIKVEADKP